MNIKENYSLKKLNTFDVDAAAKYYAEITGLQQLIELIKLDKFSHEEKLLLGSGSNILFTKNFNGLVIKNSIPGIEISGEDDEHVIVKAGAGVVWDDLVEYCVSNNFGGVENLSLIPGTVGAAPIQNIGAYGVELSEVFHSADALFLDSGKVKTYFKEDCDFSYRDSIFKSKLKNKIAVISVILKLKRKPKINIGYTSLKNEFLNQKEKDLTIADVRNAVIRIRQSKLPDPAELPNAGSFFKNPEVDAEVLKELKSSHSDLKYFEISKNRFKIPAGWLIEKCGLKGKREKSVGTYDKQALVIVNYGSADGEEIKKFSEIIHSGVKNKFGIDLETEVNII